MLFHLAQRHAATAHRALGIALDHPHIQLRRLDDGAEVQAILLRVADWDWKRASAVLHLANAGVAFIGAQRIAAGCGEVDHAVEHLARQSA